MYVPFVSRTYSTKWFDALALGLLVALSFVLRELLFPDLTGWREHAGFWFIFWSFAMTYFHERTNWHLKRELNKK